MGKQSCQLGNAQNYSSISFQIFINKSINAVLAAREESRRPLSARRRAERPVPFEPASELRVEDMVGGVDILFL